MEFDKAIVEEDIVSIIRRIKKTDWEFFRNTTVLITGSTGTIAQYLVRTLFHLNKNFDFNVRIVISSRNLQRLYALFGDLSSDKNVRIVELDVTNKLDIDEKIDYIIHAASNASQYAMVNDPIDILTANAVGTLNLAEFAVKNKVQQVHFLSTREVYGNATEERITESCYGGLDSLDVRAAYPESKRFAENVLITYRYQHGLNVTISRIAHVYGPGMSLINDGRVMSDFLHYAINKKNIVLKSDGLAERAFMYIVDAVIGIFTIMIKGQPGEAYNLANETEPVLIKDVAEFIAQTSEDKIEVVFQIPDHVSMGYSKIERKKLDTGKIQHLGWRPEVDLRTGISRTLASFNN